MKINDVNYYNSTIEGIVINKIKNSQLLLSEIETKFNNDINTIKIKLFLNFGNCHLSCHPKCIKRRKFNRKQTKQDTFAIKRKRIAFCSILCVYSNLCYYY